MDFLAWMINALHMALGGTRKPGSSIIHKALQGMVQVTTREAGSAPADSGEDDSAQIKQLPFLYLTVDVPAAPLFKDALERNIIPQVSPLRSPDRPLMSPHDRP